MTTTTPTSYKPYLITTSHRGVFAALADPKKVGKVGATINGTRHRKRRTSHPSR